MTDKLKPCPFCGSEVELEKNPLWYGNGRGYKDCYEFKIRCKKCGCRVDQPKNDSVYRSEEKAKKNAIAVWNRRVQPEWKMGKWIPCSERLPEEEEDVLVTRTFLGCKDGSIPPKTYVEVAERIGDDWVALSDEYKIARHTNPIAWMPLPEPYQEESKHETD